MLNTLIAGLIAGSISFAQAPYGIATIAGVPYDPSGDGGPALQASFHFGSGSVAWRDGNLYVTNGPRVQRIDPGGIVHTIAGQLDPVVHQPIPGYSGDGGSAFGAKLGGVTALEFDSAGNLYIGDQGNFCVRKITARVVAGVPQPIDGSETISSFAGTCTVSGNSGDGGPATAATMIGPRGMSFNPVTGDLYIVDQYNNNVRKVDASGMITTVAGAGPAGGSGDGGPANAAELNFPLGVSVDPATDDLYIADVFNRSVRKVHAGIITTVTAAGSAIKVSYRGGSLYLLSGGVVRKLDASNTLTTLAGSGAPSYTGPFPPVGDGGLATAAFLNGGANGTLDFAFDNSGFYVIDGTAGRVRYVASSAAIVFGQFVAAGNITTVAGPGGVPTFGGDGGPALSSRLLGPVGIAVDPLGPIYVADTGNNRIRSIDHTRTINTIAGNGTASANVTPGPATATGLIPQFLRFNNGALYTSHDFLSVFEIVGGAINYAFPTNTGASNMAFDPTGVLYVVDPFTVVVWEIDPVTLNRTRVVGGGSIQIDGAIISSAPANQIRILSPGALAFDPFGNGYLAESGKNRILKIAARGYRVPFNGSEMVTIYAGAGAGFSGDGGPATAARLDGPTGLATDPAGNLYFSDGVNFRIRKIDPSGIISTVAGTGIAGFAGDGGPALAAQMRTAQLALDSDGNIFFTDGGNNAVRVLDNTPPKISGMPANCSIWPPNGKMVPVATVTTSDSGAGVASFTVTGASNEPSATPQISITQSASGAYEVSLLADRLGNGSGRIYTLTATARDRAGNAASATATCTVPHDSAK